MKVSVEISLYPLDKDFIPPIQAFIDRLNTYSGIQVKTNVMSTQIFGDYASTLAIVSKEMHRLHEQTPKAAFVMKVLNGDLSYSD